MLLCHVAAGRSFETTVGRPFMEDPRVAELLAQGYSSIRGVPTKPTPEEAAERKDVLNYDELVIYDERQSLPAFLIVYELPSPAGREWIPLQARMRGLVARLKRRGPRTTKRDRSSPPGSG